MLVSLNVNNFRSFREELDFSMEADKQAKYADTHVFRVGNLPLLSTAVIYGANASGKSNLLKAFVKLKETVLESTSLAKGRHYRHEPFLMDTTKVGQPSHFQIEIVLEEVKYKYGLVMSNKALILQEWLCSKALKPRARERTLFSRKNDEISVCDDYRDCEILRDKTRPDALFLSVTAQFNHSISKAIVAWFEQTEVLSGLPRDVLSGYSFDKLQDQRYAPFIVELVKSADMGISDIVSKNIPFEELVRSADFHRNVVNILPRRVVEQIETHGLSKVGTVHMLFNQENEFVGYQEFDFEQESDGTKKLVYLAGFVVSSLMEGKTIIVDELDNSLHTELVRQIVELYHDKSVNTKNAQLIFSTHDTSLLDQEIFRRDQIWFVQKDMYGASELYSLADFARGGTRSDRVLGEKYLKGKFGGGPCITRLWSGDGAQG